MSTDIKSFSESAKGFTKSPLGIIALFIVLVYGFATLAATFGSNLKENVTPLIYFLVIFPVIVFCGFLWLVSQHHDKIYGPSDFKNEENFLKMKMTAVASLTAATAIAEIKGKETIPTGAPITTTTTIEPKNINLSDQQINSIVELVSKTTRKDKPESHEKWKNKILWVDDRPENNVYERKAFESQGLTITLALSTNEAINELERNKYAAIISDMGRREGPQEGYVLLDKIRNSGNQIPFFIYAGSNSPEHKKMALEKGAQGSTNRAQELFEIVMNKISKD
jgi:CheY-like chemotaxis protein